MFLPSWNYNYKKGQDSETTRPTTNTSSTQLQSTSRVQPTPASNTTTTTRNNTKFEHPVVWQDPANHTKSKLEIALEKNEKFVQLGSETERKRPIKTVQRKTLFSFTSKPICRDVWEDNASPRFGRGAWPRNTFENLRLKRDVWSCWVGIYVCIVFFDLWVMCETSNARNSAKNYVSFK